MKWAPLVWDFEGTAVEEQAKMIEFGQNGWELVAVVSISASCRRGYFRREILGSPSPKNFKLEAISRIINKLGAYEFHAVIKALKGILNSNNAQQADAIVKEYQRTHC